MKSAELQKKIFRLRAQIDDLRYRYHVMNDPEVTDAMYEGLTTELRKIEDAHPELVTSDSPTQRIAGQPLKKFEKVLHAVPQWSFNDAFTREDMEDWQERILRILEKQLGARPPDLDYVCELKIDGLHIVLTYENGQLAVAATRGDGRVGEDVTQNIRTIQSVPITLQRPVSLVAEGEVWLSASMLESINADRKAKNEPLFANPRNAAAGTIRQLDSRIVAKRKLQLTAYDISKHANYEKYETATGELNTQAGELTVLQRLGFKTDTHWKVCKTIDEIVELWEYWQKNKMSQPFWVDGIVIKVNQKKYQDTLGFTGKAPRWAIALKFPAEQGTTKIKEVYAQVGRTGALTPVALMEPVKLAGTTVTHATLHNFDEIKRLDVRVGDTVVVEKAGDIIPKVIRVLEKMRIGHERKIREPKHCPMCRSRVERRQVVGNKTEKSAGLFCANPRCFAQELGRIIHFVSKRAFDVDGLGEKIVEQLIQSGLIKNAADIFRLSYQDLEPLERFAEKSAQNLITAIQAAREVTLARFIYGLGIPQVGEETAIRLAKHFGSIEKVMTATEEKLVAVNDVGPRVAGAIGEFFSDNANQRLVKELLKNGVKIISHKSEIINQKLSGKIFVLTGSLKSLERDEAKDKIRALGGGVSESVSKKTSYVVAGENPGSKYDKAKMLGIEILNEQEFLALLK